MGFKRRKGREEEEEEEEAGNEDLTPTIRSLWWSVMWKGVSGSRRAPRHACSYIFASVSLKYWHYKEWEGITRPPASVFPSIPLSSGHFTASEWDNPHTPTTNHTSVLTWAEPITGRSTLPTFPKANLCIFPPVILTKEVQICIHSSQPLSHHFCKQALTQIQQYHH